MLALLQLTTVRYFDCREKVGLAVLRLIESGELSKLQKKWWYEKGECLAEGEGKVGLYQL